MASKVYDLVYTLEAIFMSNFLKSLFTDKDWDGDLCKVFGFCVSICGIVGFFLALPEWSIMLGIGGTMIATGKFSKQG